MLQQCRHPNIVHLKKVVTGSKPDRCANPAPSTMLPACISAGVSWQCCNCERKTGMAEGAVRMWAVAAQHPVSMHPSAACVAAVLCADIRVSCSIFLVFEYCTHDLGQHPVSMHAVAAHVAAVLCADIRVPCSIFLVFEYCTHDLGQHPVSMHAVAAHVAAVLCADIRVSCSIFLVFEYCTHDLGQLVDAMPRPFSPSEVKCLMLQVPLLAGPRTYHPCRLLPKRQHVCPNRLLPAAM